VAMCLAYPSQGFQLSLMVGASADHIRGALQQRRQPVDPWQPLGFFARKLDSTQVKYSALDRELLACFQAIRHFHFMLEGRRFTLFTDHKPLTTAVRRSTEPWTAKQCRQLVYIAEFTSDIQYIAGSDNLLADALSRPPSGTAAGSGSELPLRGTVRADRGDKDKIKLSTSSGRLKSSVEALPEVNAGRLRRPRSPSGSVSADTAGSIFNIPAGGEASGRRRGTPLRRLQRGSEAAGTARGQARRLRRLSRISPRRHMGHQAAHRPQGDVARPKQRRGRMGQELPAV
jgi:hypothetical protein